MNKKYERFIVKQTHGEIEILFNEKRIPVYVPLFIFLIILAIFLFITSSIDIFGLIIFLTLSLTFIFIGLHQSSKPSPKWLITNKEFKYSCGDDMHIFPLDKIKKIDIETKINKGGFPLLPLILTGIYKIVFILDDSAFVNPGFNFDFKGNAEKFAEFLKKAVGPAANKTIDEQKIYKNMKSVSKVLLT